MRSSRTLLLALAVVAGCRSVPRATGDAELTVRARLLRIEDTRRPHAVFLDSALRAPQPALRRAAAFTTGRVGARRHAAALRTLVADGDPGVASAALYALGLLKDTSAAALATAALRRAPEVSAEAAWLLGEIGESGRAPLLAAAIDTSLGTARRGAALLALARLRPVPSAPIVPLLADGDTALAWRAAYVVARARSAAAVRAMLAATGSSNVDVRDYAARGLARSLTGDSLGARALDALRRLAVDASPRVRVTAARVLGAYGAAAAAPLALAMRDPDPSVRVTAASFAHVALDTSAQRWSEAWRAETSFVGRRALAESGARRGQLRDAWREWTSDSSWQRRAAAAALDGIGPASAALDRLARYTADADGRVRAAAVEALAALADSASVTQVVRARLRAAMSDADFVVRSTSLGALAKGATAEDLAAAIGSYELARRDADLDARLAFWTLADSALRRASTSLPDSIERALGRLTRPADPLERARAAGIRRFESWRDSTSEARPDDWYLARAREARAARRPLARIVTGRGTIELELYSAEAPVTVHNFASLATRGYFDGLRFHRVVPNFVIQDGDPRGDGNGGPGYAIRDELNPHRYVRGTLGMALSGPNTGGSQWFVTHAAQPHLDGGYTVFGQLRQGGDVLDRIVQGDRIVRITIH
ncbi:MAG TPA: peptidylprolyl isomerase [Gemmatimonadaceae bacterium]|nr:peptidylprolyl isomerase [Gemmatimonadaceae bacterium]